MARLLLPAPLRCGALIQFTIPLGGIESSRGSIACLRGIPESGGIQEDRRRQAHTPAAGYPPFDCRRSSHDHRYAPAAEEVELAIGGMTCASCAARIEKKLNRMDGVTATVNYATEKAKVSYAGGRRGRRSDRHRRGDRLHRRGARAARADRSRRRRRRGRSATAAAAAAAAHRRGARRPRRRDGDGPRAAVRQLAVAVADPRRARRRLRAPGPSTGPPGPTPGTARPPWTP